LTQEHRVAICREVAAVAAADATLLMIAWAPGRRLLLPRGMSREDILAAFPGWKVIDEEALELTGAPGLVRKAEPRFYRFHRD
jgi:hypothetical protein